MSIYSTGTSFDTPTTINAWIEYPFSNSGDSVTKLYCHTMRVSRLNYSPLSFDDVMTSAGEKPIRSPFSDDSGAYWVEDTVPTALDGGIVEFDRKFANIPQSRIEGASNYSFTFPGVTDTSIKTLNSTSTAESAIHDSTTNEGVMTFDVPLSEVKNFPVGLIVNVQNQASTLSYFQVKIAGVWYNKSIRTAYISSVNGTTIQCRVDLNQYNGTDFRSELPITTFAVKYTLPARDPFTVNGNCKINYSYIKTNDIANLTGISKFQVLENPVSGTPTNILSSSSVPTFSEYANLIIIGQFLNAEIGSAERWKGNIWEKKEILVQAQ